MNTLRKSIEELKADKRLAKQYVQNLETDLRETKAKLKRLESRGFEDLHHENEQLKAKLDAVELVVADLDTQCTNSHAVKLLRKALQG